MTYALMLVKGIAKKREKTISVLNSLINDKKFAKDTGTKILEVFISFGWADFVVLMKSNNVELLKTSIIQVRDIVSLHGDNIETSTIICTTTKELEQKKLELMKKLKKKNDL